MPNHTTRWIDTGAQVLIGATALAAACIALAGSGLRASGDAPARRLRAAMQAYDARQWPQAYDQLAAAADAGDPSAARVATMMARQGPVLFGRRFDVSPERLRQWEQSMRGQAADAPADRLTSRETDARTAGSPRAVLVARAR